MYGYSTNPTKRFKYPFYVFSFKFLSEIQRDILRDDRVPTLFIKLNSLFKLLKKEVSLIKISIKLFSDLIFLFELLTPMIIMLELEIFRGNLKIRAGLILMVIFSIDMLLRIYINTVWDSLHELFLTNYN